LSVVPADFDKTYLAMARQGARLLALGYRHLGMLSHQQVSLSLSVCLSVSLCCLPGDGCFDSTAEL